MTLTFDEIISKNLPIVKNICRNVAYKFKKEYEDIYGDVLEKICKYKDKYDHKSDAQFAAWVNMIAKNVAIDGYRKDVKEGFKTDLEYGLNSEDESERDYTDIDLLDRVQKYIAENHPMQVEVFRLLSEGYKYSEIAERLGQNVVTVRVRVSKIRDELRIKRQQMTSDFKEIPASIEPKTKIVMSIPETKVTEVSKFSESFVTVQKQPRQFNRNIDLNYELAYYIVTNDSRMAGRYLREQCMNCGSEKSSYGGTFCKRCFGSVHKSVKKAMKDFRFELWMKGIKLNAEMLKKNDERRNNLIVQLA